MKSISTSCTGLAQRDTASATCGFLEVLPERDRLPVVPIPVSFKFTTKNKKNELVRPEGNWDHVGQCAQCTEGVPEGDMDGRVPGFEGDVYDLCIDKRQYSPLTTRRG